MCSLFPIADTMPRASEAAQWSISIDTTLIYIRYISN